VAGRTNTPRNTREARLVEQLPLFVEAKQPKRRRKKPGPKRKRGSSAPHRRRPELSRRHPVHVVLRVVDTIGSLRKRFMYAALRDATVALALREHAYNERAGAFRIVHISIQRTHVHLIVEADNKTALSRGMQSFQVSAAKLLNRAYSKKAGLDRRRRGTVFPDRFHQEIITSPKQARSSLAYVLNNWRKHREDRGDDQRGWNVDPFSSGVQFDGWRERADAVLHWSVRETYQPLVVYSPKTWLLRVAWRKHGLVAFREVPSASALAA
jgi:REP element-mobilizing transposase RayT